MLRTERLPIDHLLDLTRTHSVDDRRWNFVTDEMREFANADETGPPSLHDYDNEALALIEACRDGWVADIGAGNKGRNRDNVINVEITAYPSTDIVAIGEALPFKDNSLDGIISSAVLEHIKHPWLAAEEIKRVVKPGGRIFIAAPFMVPEHGYPHHFFNMTRQGLASLFDDKFEITRHYIPDSMVPSWTLHWYLAWWAEGTLSPEAKEAFLNTRIGDIIQSDPNKILGEPWGRLNETKTWELASGTIIHGIKKSS